MQYSREVIIVFLVVVLAASIRQCDLNKAEITTRDAEKVRHSQISSAQAGRGAVLGRETDLYPGVDKRIEELERQRAELKRRGHATSPTKKDITDAVQNQTQNDINNTAHLYVLAGYSSTVR